MTMAVEPAGVLIIRSFAFHNIDAGTLNTFCPAFVPVRMIVPYWFLTVPVAARAA